MIVFRVAVRARWLSQSAEVSHTHQVVGLHLYGCKQRVLGVTEQLADRFDVTAIRTAARHLSLIFYANGCTEEGIFAVESWSVPMAIQPPAWLGGAIWIAHNWRSWPAASSKEHFA